MIFTLHSFYTFSLVVLFPFLEAIFSNIMAAVSTQRVVSLGAGLIFFGMIGKKTIHRINEDNPRAALSLTAIHCLYSFVLGFGLIPGMIIDDAGGSKLVNAFYCSGEFSIFLEFTPCIVSNVLMVIDTFLHLPFFPK